MVCVTEGILKTLEPQELEGVLAHELAHVKNGDMLLQTVAATLSGAIGMVSRLGLVVPSADSRRRAPGGAARADGDPAERRAAGGGLSRLFSTHPPVAERIERLRAIAAGQPADA